MADSISYKREGANLEEPWYKNLVPSVCISKTEIESFLVFFAEKKKKKKKKGERERGKDAYSIYS